MLLACCVISSSHADDVGATVEAKLRADVSFLSDDAREGRGVGTTGIHESAEYIAQSFEKSGLRVDLFSGKPFQELTIPVSASLGPAEENRLQFVPADPNTTDARIRSIDADLNGTFRPLAVGEWHPGALASRAARFRRRGAPAFRRRPQRMVWS